VALGVGSQEWYNRFVWVFSTHLPNALRLYSSLGVDAEIVRRCRLQLMRRTGAHVAGMLVWDPVALAGRAPIAAMIRREGLDLRSIGAMVGGLLASLNLRRPSVRRLAGRL